MSSTINIPELKEINSDHLFYRLVDLAHNGKAWVYEEPLSEKFASNYHSTRNVLFFIPFVGGMLAFGVWKIAISMMFKIILILAGIGIIAFFALHYLNRSRARYRFSQGFGDPQLTVEESMHQAGGKVVCRLKQAIKHDGYLESREVLAKLSCYEVIKSSNGTTDFYQHTELWSSPTQQKDMSIYKGDFVVQFSFEIPQQVQPSSAVPQTEVEEPDAEVIAAMEAYVSKNKLSKQMTQQMLSNRRISEQLPDSSIWWLIEAYQMAFDNHFYVPIQVQSHHQRVN